MQQQQCYVCNNIKHVTVAVSTMQKYLLCMQLLLTQAKINVVLNIMQQSMQQASCCNLCIHQRKRLYIANNERTGVARERTSAQ